MFRRLFSRNAAPLAGAPEIRRVKTFSAQSGYVYQYYFDGRRPFGRGVEAGTEYVFQASADRKNLRAVSVLVGDAVLRLWERERGRELSAAERYAVAKMALFQAFDERSTPEEMGRAINVRPADLTAILDSLQID